MQLLLRSDDCAYNNDELTTSTSGYWLELFSEAAGVFLQHKIVFEDFGDLMCTMKRAIVI